MVSLRSLPVWLGIVVLTAIFLMGQETWPPCTGDEECDDGQWCNGEERCVNHVCKPGVPVDCDDGDACTDDTCNESTGCEHECNASGTDDPCCCSPGCQGRSDLCVPGYPYITWKQCYECVSGELVEACCQDENVCSDEDPCCYCTRSSYGEVACTVSSYCGC